MATYTAPSEWPFIPSGSIPLEGTFLLPVCTTRERLLKMLSILNVWKNVDENNSDYDPIHDIVTALPYIQNPAASPCMGLSGNDCVDYPTGFTRIIEWIPNNPYAEVQPSYNPWYRLAVDNDITGQRAGDILADLTSIGVDPLEPMPDPSPELPRYRVTVEGTGTLELHMVSVPFGGMAQVQVDGDVLQLTYVDLNQDFASVPPELYSANVWVHEFTTPGVHFVDVTILPRLNDEATAFVGWGGGLRKIVLCGFNEPARVPMFRFTEECGLEYRFTEADPWGAVPGWNEFAFSCFEGAPGAPGAPGEAGPPGAPGEAGPPGYDSAEDVPTPAGGASPEKACDVATAIADGILNRYKDWLAAWIDVLIENANDYNAAYNELLTGAQGTLAGTAVAAGATANALPFFIGTTLTNILGIGAIFSGITAYFAGKEALDWLAVETAINESQFRSDLICLILGSIGEDGNLTAEIWQEIRDGVPSLESASAAARNDFADFLARSVPVAIARMYALTPTTGDCSDCGGGLCEPLDMMGFLYAKDFCFRDSDYNMIIGALNVEPATWVAGEGFVSGRRIASSVQYDQLNITFPRAWANLTLTGCVIRVEYTLNLGTTFGGTSNYMLFQSNGGSVTYITLDRAAADANKPVYMTAAGNRNFGPGQPTLSMIAGQRFNADPGGSVTIHRLTILHNSATDPYPILPEDL